MVTILLANGFEVAEALVTLDLLHRAGVEACLTGLHSGEVTSANGVRVKMDRVLPEIGEEALGALIYFFEFACGVSGYMEGVNPFNQPGVEAYKKNMFHLLGKPGY